MRPITIISALAGAVSCNLDPHELTANNQAPAQQLQTPNVFLYVQKLFGFLRYYLHQISSLYPLNVLFAIFSLVIFLYIVFQLLSSAAKSLLGLEMQYTSAYDIGGELRSMKEQVQTVQKEARQINKYLRVKAREQEAKASKDNSNSNHGITQQQQPSLIPSDLLKQISKDSAAYQNKLEEVRQKIQFSANMENEIKRWCNQMLEFLKNYKNAPK